MAEDKEVVISSSDSPGTPDFIQGLLPSAQRTALLYHLSYLCLGGFPKLERLLRERALETQLLFGSSEAVLLKCVGTSDNLVKSLLPSLKVAAEKNKPQLALKFLEKAKGWITEIIMDVKDIVKRYNTLNNDVATSTSDIITEKTETEKKQKEQTMEMQALQKIVEDLDANLQKLGKEVEESEKKIEQKNAEIQQFISSISSTKEEASRSASQMPGAAAMMGPQVAMFSMMVPFVESVMGFISKMVTAPSNQSMVKTLQSGLTELTTAHQALKDREWNLQNQQMDNQLKLAKLKIENGQLPCITHLDEVQVCLSRIQQILVQLQKFWEKVASLLDVLKNKTFAGESWIEELADLKEEFIESISAAKEGWVKFGISCTKANAIFSIQADQAYRFLEINPSSLSKEQWEREYNSVKQKLEKIKPNVASPAALTQ